ncbi:MAG TPA: hypothetical protein VJZ00_21075 [Thermoanaerobaculia bacterium]|nr:hypothetical protein [Thermoanaerobaculia bacterium]
MRIPALLFSLLFSFSLLAQRTNDLIVPLSGAPSILIPAAGDVTGANGTHFRSDISVINLRNAAQRVQISWLPQGATGIGIAPFTMDLPAQSGFSSENFAFNVLQRTGLGSIVIMGVRSDNSFDPEALLHATARIWTPRPDGGAGTMSQTFPAIALSSNENVRVKAIFGTRRTAQYRLNVGISNPIAQARKFRVTVIVSGTGPTQAQFDMDVPAQSMDQRNVDIGGEGLAQFLIEDITATNPVGPWHAWASSIDNDSGDAWSQMAVPGV